jgi:hypothetical protein
MSEEEKIKTQIGRLFVESGEKERYSRDTRDMNIY